MAESSREREATADAERRLGRIVSRAVPGVTLVTALGVAAAAGLGPGILVLAAGALVGTIALLWSSLRTLSGDAPLAEAFALAGAARRTDEAAERKRALLRTLKDLELEHAVGKIDDKDYGTLSSRFREEAKALMRKMDVEAGPLRASAEALAQAHLERKGLSPSKESVVPAGSGTAEDAPTAGAPEADVSGTLRSRHSDKSRRARRDCARCNASNEPDAAFCKKCGNRLAPDEDGDAALD